MLDLLSKLQCATGPDRRLDTEIGLALDIETAWSGDLRQLGYAENVFIALGAQPYTASLDAAMTLIPAGVRVLDFMLSWDTLADQSRPACSIRWYEPGDSGTNWKACSVSAKTQALTVALAAITLRSRAALMDDNRD